MIIECLVKREGPTTIVLGQTKYLFTPVPGAKKGEMSTSICDIVTEEHLNYLLNPARGGQFREFEQEQTEQDRKVSRSKDDTFLGYSIQKYHDSGYMIVDLRAKNKPLFVGMDGLWKEQAINLTPFPTEFQAFNWLKEELEEKLAIIEEEETPKKKEPKSKT
jgi:hypothetical protein